MVCIPNGFPERLFYVSYYQSYIHKFQVPTLKDIYTMAYMVYILNKEGSPLMPTKDFLKVRILLKTKAAVVQRIPFTIKLTTRTHNYV